ncbi:protein of unknown function [Paraburkholderia kururiensis]
MVVAFRACTAGAVPVARDDADRRRNRGRRTADGAFHRACQTEKSMAAAGGGSLLSVSEAKKMESFQENDGGMNRYEAEELLMASVDGRSDCSSRAGSQSDWR